MRLFDKRKPNVKMLARKGDVDGLIAAAGYTELVPGSEGGTTVDVGASIREDALFALRDIALDRAGDVFVTALDDSSDRVRTAAVVALYERGDAERLAEAVACLPAGSGKARATAVRALFQLRSAGSGSKLAQALVNRRDLGPLSEEEEELVLALVRAEDRPEAAEEVVQLLIPTLDHGDEVVIVRAEALLVRLGPASIGPLIRELEVGAAPHRAVVLIGEIRDARALQPLVAALSHPDARVRGQSCSALGKLRDPAAVEPLLRATQDPEHSVRVRASDALDAMGTAAIAVSIAALLRPTLGQPVANVSPLGRLSNGGAGHSIELAPVRPALEGPTRRFGLRSLASLLGWRNDHRGSAKHDR
ncbi:MAG TPA: HEAT repeat domain-containing protein [Solirubrobacteraceae bacterium]|nr:HEAT repeat domain-containing protein [Solirubrobacteraceae bacterium]